jgi:hypothetical protein
MDSGNQPSYPPPSQESLRDKQREVEAKAQLQAQRRAARNERGDSTRGIRGTLRRVREAIRRRS